MDWLVGIGLPMLVVCLAYGYGFLRRPISPARQRWISRAAVVFTFFVAGPAWMSTRGGTLTEGMMLGFEMAILSALTLVIFGFIEKAAVLIRSRGRQREES